MDKMKQIYELARSATIEEIQEGLKNAECEEEKFLYCSVQLVVQREENIKAVQEQE